MTTSSRGRGPVSYEIRVLGHLDPHWSTWFTGLTLTHQDDGTTSLHGVVTDQAELHGLLAKVRDLGATLLSVTPDDAAHRSAAADAPADRPGQDQHDEPSEHSATASRSGEPSPAARNQHRLMPRPPRAALPPDVTDPTIQETKMSTVTDNTHTHSSQGAVVAPHQHDARRLRPHGHRARAREVAAPPRRVHAAGV